MKIKLNGFINKDKKTEDVVIEIQEMDLGIFYDIQTSFTMGQISLSQLATRVLQDTIVAPVEARNIEFFSNHPKALDLLIGQIRGFLGKGIAEPVKIEIIEE